MFTIEIITFYAGVAPILSRLATFLTLFHLAVLADQIPIDGLILATLSWFYKGLDDSKDCSYKTDLEHDQEGITIAELLSLFILRVL